MKHTVKVVAGGLVLLAACLLIGYHVGRPTPAAGLIAAIKVFIPLWFCVAGINMWVGVSKAGYSVTEEVPYFLAVFAAPVVLALFLWWKVGRA